MCLCVLSECGYVHLLVQVPTEARRGLELKWLWATQRGCWEPNPSSLQKQCVLFSHWAVSPAPTCLLTLFHVLRYGLTL